jgi:regulator of protease activity HflC (stomatin/prohibitin superfamily)
MGFVFSLVFVSLLLFGISKIPKDLTTRDEQDRVLRSFSLLWLRRALAGTIGVFFLLSSFLVVVPPGEAKVGVLFGNVQEEPYRAGPHLRNPLLDFVDFDLRRQSLDFNSTGDPSTHEDDVLAMSSNELPMSIDSTFGFQYNAKWLSWVMNNLQDVRETLLLPASRSAVRSSAAKFAAVDAAVVKRQDFETSLQSEFEKAVIEGLVGQGLTPEQAKEVFIFLPVQLRKVLPPQKVLDANTDEEAAERMVGVETKMTAVMEERAKRLTQVGLGYANAMKELPAGVPVKDASGFIEALALREAVEKDKVSVIVMNGGATPAISVK